MIVGADGDVGIGTTSPSEKLTISASNSGGANNNTLRFVDTDVTTQANQSFGKIEFETKDTNNAGVNAFINAFAEGTGGTGALSFGTGSGGSSERMRLDSSGNLLVAKTSANNSTVGVELKTDGSLNPTVDGDTVARFNRLTSDGEIIRLQKDTTTVGVIGTQNWGIYP